MEDPSTFPPSSDKIRIKLPQTGISEKFQAGKSYHSRLLAMPDSELFSLYLTHYNERRAKLEREHWSNVPPATAAPETYDHWSKAAYWSADEAAALLVARNPSELTRETAEKSREQSSVLRSFLAVRDLIERSLKAGQIDEKKEPNNYVEWAKRNGINIPAGLEEAVVAQGHRVADWKGICERQSNEIFHLNARIALLELANSDSPPGMRERDSMLKMIIGMAIKGYAYNPKASRSPIAQEISGDLDRLGISLDSDTIRKYLNDAKELLPGRTK